MILFLSTQDPLTSRNRSLINFLENDYNKSFKTLIVSNKSIFSLFFRVYKSLRIYKPQKIVIGYNSRVLVLYIYILKIIFEFDLIYDLGYPISDIPKLNFLRRVLLSVFDYLLIKFSVLVIVESLEQKLFVESKYNKSVIVYFAYIDFPISLHVSSRFDFNYFLFRGRLNYESGILTWISEFIKYKRHGSYKLVILGYGDLETDVNNLIKNNLSDIIFLNSYVAESELISIISNASCLLGQINSNESRLQKTIPHKFFESVYFRKVYLGYIYPPVRTIIGDTFFNCGLQLDPTDPVCKISDLFFNFESLDENSLAQNVDVAYNLLVNSHIRNKICLGNSLQ